MRNTASERPSVPARRPSSGRRHHFGWQSEGVATLATPELSTERLVLSALKVAYATEMVEVLSASELYEFTGGTAPTESELRQRYRDQLAGPSDPIEQWHNWIVRLGSDGPAMGYVQATVRGGHAEIAWVIGRPWQGRGYATEATRAMFAWLTSIGDVQEVTANIHPDHTGSRRVASSAGLEPSSKTVDGEQVWQWLSRS